MKRSIIGLLVLLFCSTLSVGQDGTYFGIKGVYGANMQLWNSYDRDPILTPGVDIYAETYEEGGKSSLYSQIGYHQRGSALRGFDLEAYRTYRFSNLVLELGAKQGITMDDDIKTYYMFGLRGEYNLSNNLDSGEANSLAALVDPSYVNKLLWGVTIGGGAELNIGNDRALLVELTVNPDLSKQYFQPFSFSYTDVNGITRNYPEQEVRNISIELKVGYRYLY